MATILIADDDPIVREIAREMLAATAHVAVMAEDGSEVIRLLAGLRVDLLVTDMLMPNMDGVELIMAVRDRYPAVKVLAISSGGSVGASYMLTVARTLGADATLQKPLQLSGFLETIEALLSAERRGPQRLAG